VLPKRCLSGSISMLRTRVKYKTVLESPIGSRDTNLPVSLVRFNIIAACTSQSNIVMTILCLLTRKVE
jgi:hypothetical protein